MPQNATWVPEPLPELLGETEIRLDAETNGLDWWDKARPVGWAWYLPKSGRKGYAAFGHATGNNCSPEAALAWSRRELRDIHVLNANTRFDTHISRVWGADLVEQGCTFGDVQHMAALLDDNRFRFNLQLLAQDFLGPDRGKLDVGVPPSEYHKLPGWALAPYAVEDVTLVHDLEMVMRPQLIEQDMLRVLKLEEDIIPVVVEMEKNGAWLDVEQLERWRAEATKEYDDQLLFIYRETGLTITSTDAPKQTEALFKARGIPITTFTAAGRPSFTEDVLKRAATGDKAIAAFFYASQLADLLSKYLNKYAATVRADGWIRFNLHQLRTVREDGKGAGTVSGRFSSAGDKDKETGKSIGFNVQQVASVDKQVNRGWCPKYIVRNLFKPQEGKWVCLDAKQIEYRIFGSLSESDDIMGRYNALPPYEKDGEHFITGPEADYHAIVQRMLRVVKPDIQRKKTKITNFCKLFGSGLLKFCHTLGTIGDAEFNELDAKYRGKRNKNRMLREEESSEGLAEGIAIYDAYDVAFPAALDLLRLAKDTARDRGYVKTALGRRARFGGRNKRFHSALNRVVQGTAADINKLFLVDAYRNRKEFGLTMLFTVHDELDTCFAEPSPENLARFEEFANQQRVDLNVPILWELDSGDSWGTAKGKA